MNSNSLECHQVLKSATQLLNQDTLKIISSLSANNIFTALTTNGYLLENYAQPIIDSGLEFISVSLDHFDEKKHDKGRGVIASHKRLIKGLSPLVALRKTTPSNIKINTVIREDNHHQLSKMYDFVENLGIEEWSVQHFNFVNPVAKQLIDNFKNKNIIGDYSEGSPINRNYFLNKKQVTTLLHQLSRISKKSQRYKTKLSIKPPINNLFSYYQGKFPSKKSSCNFPFNSINITRRL